MTSARRFAGIIIAVAAVLVPVACDAPTAPPEQALRLTTHLGKTQYFENEPIYFVFEVANEGQHPQWVNFFGLSTQHLRAEVLDSNGYDLPGLDFVVDYVCSPRCGQPLDPGASLFDLGMLQDRWGLFDGTLTNMYFGLHIPPGRYTVRARFYWYAEEPRPSLIELWRPHPPPPIEAVPVSFRVVSRTPHEDSLFATAQRFADMPWDTTQRAGFLGALVDYVTITAANDPANPFLPYATVNLEGDARFFVGNPDAPTVDRLEAARFAIANAERDTPAGAVTAAGVYADRPGDLITMAGMFANSLTGRVAAALYRQYTTPQQYPPPRRFPCLPRGVIRVGRC